MENIKNIAGIRKEYSLETLDEKMAHADPFQQFEKWWQQAVNSDIDEVNAMTLSTISQSNKPSSRIVLLKGFNEDGFVFFTNYESNKAAAIQHNPNVSLVIFWKELQRQVRIEGAAEKLGDKENDEYFDSRPDSSKIGAWASPQSKVIGSRAVLESNQNMYEQKFSGSAIPRPPHWGGYITRPVMVEFWQGRPGRLHDRICYTRIDDRSWKKERLAP